MSNNNFYVYFLKVIDWLESAKKSGKTLRETAIEKNLHDDFFYDYKRKTVNKLFRTSRLSKEDYNKFIDLYNDCLKNSNNHKNKETYTDEDEGVELVKNSEYRVNGKISYYYYEIRNKFGKVKTGTISRDEMSKIYNLYSYEGANVTKRTVSREFPRFTFQEFKKIMNAFCITKSSIPIAIHDLEEKTEEENIDEINRVKENNLLKKIEEDRIKNNEIKVKSLIKENEFLKNRIKDTDSFLVNMDFSNIVPYKIPSRVSESNSIMLVYLADWHIGCYVDKDSIYENNYDENELWNRLTKLLKRIDDEYQLTRKRFKKIILCNLGDSLDGFNSETTRGGHKLEQNMNNREQFKVFVNLVIKLINSIYDMDVADNIEYIATGDSNHDGDFGYIANKTIQYYLSAKYPEMNVRVFEKFIEYFNVGENNTFILCHGKDKEQMFKNFPLNLDEKTENYINGFLDYHGITSKNIHFIKADLHQSSLNYGRRFRYRNVSSIFGSSKWIHYNFGNTKAAIDYDIVHIDKDIVSQGRIVLN